MKIKVQEADVKSVWTAGKPDILVRLLPFLIISLVAYYLLGQPAYFGLNTHNWQYQLLFGGLGCLTYFAGSLGVRMMMARKAGVIGVPKNGMVALAEASYYVLNACVEELFFRGFMQGALSVVLGPAWAFFIATSSFVFYHRLLWDDWSAVLTTAFLGIPMGLVFWFQPAPPSLIGIAITHVGATCGFLHVGPWVLQKLGFLD